MRIASMTLQRVQHSLRAMRSIDRTSSAFVRAN